MIAPPFAHFGHVLIDLPIFAGPVIGLAAWVFYVTRKDKRRHKAGS